MNTCRQVFLLLSFIISLSRCGEVSFSYCHEPAENVTADCVIHQLRVDPCEEAKQDKPCNFVRGINASVSFDYTPNFSGDLIGHGVYWPTAITDLAFPGMPKNPCKFTTCPLTANQRNSYSLSLPISKKFPAKGYEIKWKVWNSNNQECCFKFHINLLK